MKKKLIILINIIGILVAFFIIEKIIYEDATKNFHKLVIGREPNKFKYLTEPLYGIDFKTYFNGKDNEFSGRKPDGLEYNSKPIVVFGCSYAHGQYLNYDETFSYKLSHLTKRPVYNRAIPAKGFPKMYYQSQSENFYKNVPKSDLVIYFMLDDHYRRMKLNYLDITDTYLQISYKKVGNELIKEDFSNPIKCFFHSTYIAKFIRSKWTHIFINNPVFADKLTEEVLLYFIETRNNIEKHWGNKVKFVVVFYDSWIKNADLLREKLEKNNFIVLETKELTNENLFSEKYFSQKTIHPTADVWKLLTPLIAEKLELSNEKI